MVHLCAFTKSMCHVLRYKGGKKDKLEKPIRVAAKVSEAEQKKAKSLYCSRDSALDSSYLELMPSSFVGWYER